MNEMKTRAADGPFIRPAAEAQAQAEPEDFARFEGEGGREAPTANLIDVPLDNAIWRKPRGTAQQTGSRRK